MYILKYGKAIPGELSRYIESGDKLYDLVEQEQIGTRKRRKTMVKGSIGDRILECIGYPESWTEQEIEDNKRVIQEEFSKIDSHVVKAVVARLCDKIEEPKIKKEKEEAERQEREKKAEIARRIRMERSVRSTPWLCNFADEENYDDSCN